MKPIGILIGDNSDWREATERARLHQARADQERREKTIEHIKAEVCATLASNGFDVVEPGQMTCIPETARTWKIAFPVGKVTAVRSKHSYEEGGYVADFEQYGWEPFYSDTGERVVFFGDDLGGAIYVARQADR